MAVDERTRRLLYDRLEEVLGVGHGDALMAHLPPVGWADVATRRDLDGLAGTIRHESDLLEQRLERRFERVDDRFGQLDDRFARQTAEITAAFRGEINAAMTSQLRHTVLAIIGVLLAVAALVAAILGLG